jgi:hypothetical protein
MTQTTAMEIDFENYEVDTDNDCDYILIPKGEECSDHQIRLPNAQYEHWKETRSQCIEYEMDDEGDYIPTHDESLVQEMMRDNNRSFVHDWISNSKPFNIERE